MKTNKFNTDILNTILFDDKKVRQYFIDSSPKHIVKKNRRVSLLPTPVEYKVFKEYITNNIQKDQRMLNNSKEAFIDIIRISNADHTRHELDNNMALTKSYLKETVRHISSRKDLFNLIFKKEYKGNSLQHLSNSYSLVNIKLNNQDNHDNQVFIKEKKIKEALDLSIDDYSIFYNTLMSKNSKEFISTNTTKQVNSNNTNTTNTTNIKNIKNIKNLTKIETIKSFLKSKQDIELDRKSVIKWTYVNPENITELKNDLSRKISTYNNTQNEDIKKSMNKYISQINNVLFHIEGNKLWHLEYKSEFYRVYSIINQMPKFIRNILFKDYINLDLDNLAYCAIYNVFNKEATHIKLTKMKHYIDFRDNIIKFFSDLLYKQLCPTNKLNIVDGDIVINRSSKLYQNIKNYLKIYLLSILFGNNIFYNKGSRSSLTNRIRDILKNNIFILDLAKEVKDLNLYIESKLEHKSPNALSSVFMNIETEVMSKISDVIGCKKSEARVHDGIFVQLKDLNKTKVEGIKSILTSYNLKMKTLDELELDSSDLTQISEIKKFKNFISETILNSGNTYIVLYISVNNISPYIKEIKKRRKDRYILYKPIYYEYLISLQEQTNQIQRSYGMTRIKHDYNFERRN